MGVAGSGKSTVGARLADALRRPFLDADDLHTDAARARMAAGTPLEDADRWPWLDRVGAWLAAHPGGVVCCSALRRAYRDRLRQHAPDVLFVLLDVPEAVLTERLTTRIGHFMPVELLRSQLATLEPLGEAERGLVVDGTLPTDWIVDRVGGYISAE